MLPMATVHPTEPSAPDSCSIICRWAGSESSAPPWLLGTRLRKHPAAVSVGDEVGWEPSTLFDLLGAGGDGRRQRADRLEHLGLTGLAGHVVPLSSSAHGRSIGASAACRARRASSHSPLQ